MVTLKSRPTLLKAYGIHVLHPPAKCAHLSLDLLSLNVRLVMQNDIQQGTMDTDVAVVVNEAQFSKFVHEKNGICGFGLYTRYAYPPPSYR